MKKFTAVFGAFLLLFGLSTAASAYTINYLRTEVGNELTSPYGGVTEDFEAGTVGSNTGLLWTWTGNGAVRLGDVSGVASAPFGVSAKDTSKYMSVPTTTSSSPQSITVTALAGSYNYFGLWWGSIDIYNELDFYDGSNLVGHYTGAGIISGDYGNQTLPASNLYVNFLGLPTFNKFVMTSTQYAFEVDNITIGNVAVPEPTTMLLLGLGLVGLAGVRRFKK